MKKTFIKMLSMLLLAIMVLSLFSACKKTDDEKEITGTVTGTDEDPQIPAQDYGEHEFTFITQSGNAYNTGYIVSEGEAGETLDDAKARRNAIIEEKYNVKITQLNVSDIKSEVRTQTMGGKCDFDVILASCGNLSVMAQENLLLNLLSIDRFDWDKSYWDSNSKDQLMIGDKLYFANCALNIHTVGFMVYFNKQLVEDYELTSPYEYMANNEWTIENWAEMVRAVSKDMDNNGNFTEMDQYGTLYEHHNPRMFLYASGVRATTNNESGYPEVTLMEDADKTVYIYEKLKEVFKNSTSAYCMDCSPVDPQGYPHRWSYLRYLFTQNLYLFHYTDSGALGAFADMESEFGVVPFPKYNKDQETYKTVYPYNNNLLALPTVNENLERTAKIVEDMNYYSSFIVEPAWFDVLLTRRYARDDESEESIRILRDNCVYDLGLYYDFGGLRSAILDVNPVSSNISRSYDRAKKAIDASIKKTYQEFTKS